MLYIQRATILTPFQRITNGAVLVEDRHIVAVGSVEQLPPPPQARVVDASGLFLVPGFIDLQLNGAFGMDFTEAPSTIWDVAARLPRHGVTSFLPTIITSPLETVRDAQAVVMGGPPGGYLGSTPLGLHLEGPFLNPAKCGAHNPAHLRQPDLALIEQWSPDQGVRLVTLAPELPGALEMIRTLRRRGVVTSVGHSKASYEEAQAGFAAGITYATHFFNAMPALDHRAPGLVGALLADRHIVIGLIPDGLHLHPAVVTLVWQAKGSASISLVTDAMAALGMPPGSYHLGDVDVIVDGIAARRINGPLAGSLLSLDQAVRNLVAFTGCPLGDALATVTTTPASLLGLGHQYGQIAPGFVADMTLLTPDYHVATTIVGGHIVYSARERLAA